MPHYVMENEYGIVGLVTAKYVKTYFEADNLNINKLNFFSWTKGYPIKGTGYIEYELQPPPSKENRPTVTFQRTLPFVMFT